MFVALMPILRCASNCPLALLNEPSPPLIVSETSPVVGPFGVFGLPAKMIPFWLFSEPALIDRLFTAINEPPVLFSPPATVTLVVAPLTNPALVKLLALIVVVVVDASDAFAALVRFGADTYSV